VRMPGDRAAAARAARRERLALPRTTVDSLTALAERLHVSIPAGLQN
jgi:hypothetical protein